MKSFSNCVVPHVTSHTSTVYFTAVWKDGIFYARKDDVDYPIDKWDDLTLPSVKQCFSLPSNTYWEQWHIKKNWNPNHSRPDLVKCGWAKYYPGMKIYGSVVNGVFYEHCISETTKQ